MLKKWDIVLIVSIAVCAILLYWIPLTQQTGSADSVTVDVDGTRYGTYSLYEDREICISNAFGNNMIVIRQQTVSVTTADCHGGECIAQGSISKSGQSIVCLPHRLIITITGKAAAYDAVAS